MKKLVLLCYLLLMMSVKVKSQNVDIVIDNAVFEGDTITVGVKCYGHPSTVDEFGDLLIKIGDNIRFKNYELGTDFWLTIRHTEGITDYTNPDYALELCVAEMNKWFTNHLPEGYTKIEKTYLEIK